MPSGGVSESVFYDIVRDAGIDVQHFQTLLGQAFSKGDGYVAALQLRACSDASARSAEAVARAWPAFVLEVEARCV